MTKNCGIEKGCWAKQEFGANGVETLLLIDGDYINKFRIADGMNVAFFIDADKRGHIYFDVNGNNKPNTRGKDIFEFMLTNEPVNSKYFQPYYVGDDNDIARCRNTGNTCAKFIMENGWKFPDDYPW